MGGGDREGEGPRSLKSILERQGPAGGGGGKPLASGKFPSDVGQPAALAGPRSGWPRLPLCRRPHERRLLTRDRSVVKPVSRHLEISKKEKC